MTFLRPGSIRPDPLARASLARRGYHAAHHTDTNFPNASKASTCEAAKQRGDDALPFHLSLLRSAKISSETLLKQDLQRAAGSDTDLATLCMREGRLDETLYYLTVAKRLGVCFVDDLDACYFTTRTAEWPLEHLNEVQGLITAPFSRFASMPPQASTVYVCAPRGATLDQLADHLKQYPELKKRVAITTPSMLSDKIHALACDRALREQVFKLRNEEPHLSAHNKFGTSEASGVLAAFSFLFVGLLLHPGLAVSFNLFTILLFMAIGFLRLLAWWDLPLIRLQDKQSLENLTQARAKLKDWPSYTVMVPLYKEAAVVPDLVHSLCLIDYPRDRLSVMLLVEEDDVETQQAIETCKLPSSFSIMRVPNRGPRTKPKALNYALSFVNSELVVIYDAEDRPHKDQLKEAALRMAAGGKSLGCLQGRLAIDNDSAGFISRNFAIEYAALFDGLLPYLAQENLPVPLGGTSNHFRTSVLKQIGGWDPFNVTEDADLGLRLTRQNYRIEILLTDTWEEAPETYGGWIKQRTRWFKGWMQTWIVHMRHPIRLLNQVGIKSFLAFHIMIAGMLVSALIHPVFILTFLSTFMGLVLDDRTHGLMFWCLLIANSFNLMFGYLGAMLLAHRATKRRYGYGLKQMFTLPLYWILMTPAAWRALFQLMRNPHHWEKTAHGVSTKRPSVGMSG